MGLGRLDLVSVSEARKAARDYRAFLTDGLDPLLEKPLEKSWPCHPSTFAQAAARFIAANRGGWKAGGKSADQRDSSLRMRKRLLTFQSTA